MLRLAEYHQLCVELYKEKMVNAMSKSTRQVFVQYRSALTIASERYHILPDDSFGIVAILLSEFTGFIVGLKYHCDQL